MNDKFNRAAVLSPDAKINDFLNPTEGCKITKQVFSTESKLLIMPSMEPVSSVNK